MSTFYKDFFTEISTTLESTITNTTGEVIGAITPVVTILLAIYIVFWGWSMMRGVISEPVTDGVTRMVKLSIICALALSVGTYAAYLSNWLWQSPDAMAGLIAPGRSSQSNMSFLDGIFLRFDVYASMFFKAASDNKSAAGIPDLLQFMLGVLILVAGVIMTGVGAFLIFLAKIALSVILAIGPIFVLTLMFESTKKFFDSWIGQALNYGLLIILVSALFAIAGDALVNAIRAEYSAAMNSAADPSSTGAVKVVAIAAIITLMLFQLPSIASALAGGVAVSGMGAVGWAYGKLKGGAAGAGRVASGKTLSDMRDARRAKAMNARWAASNPSAPVRAGRAAASALRSTTNSVKKS